MNSTRDTKGRFSEKHGGRHERLYSTWCSMKERCFNPHNKRFFRYGGRGISVCDEWVHDYGKFREWALNNGYSDELTIDRIDNEKGYTPSNCRWVTRAEQNRNYSRNHFVTYQGKTMCIADWEKETGIKRATILYRLRSGKSLDEVFFKGDGRTKDARKKHI